MKRLDELHNQILTGQASEEEIREWRNLLRFPENRQRTLEIFRDLYSLPPFADMQQEAAEAMVRHIVMIKTKRAEDSGIITPVHRVHFLRTAWSRYAAAVLLVIAATVVTFWLNNHTKKSNPLATKTINQQILPGTNKATLILADGTTIALDTRANGAIARQGNVKIIKPSGGQIVYTLTGQRQSEVMMNTISTPRGGQYQLTLPDGTKAWLNAESSITYPAVFTGAERRVDIQGEVYLEIAPNSKQPFKATTSGTEIQVLGTSFNVNAYTNEKSVKTTLVEGSVKLITSEGSLLLKPGQQGETISGNIKLIKDASISEALAWKNGFFNLQNADLQTVMRQLERWYDIEVKYEGPIPVVTFKGEMDRGMSLSSIRQSFSDLGIATRLEGRTLIVTR
jgi:ferric-dicitrate binding protein FerR (iron transport regulator)